jgi:hypothetical protein
MENQKEEEVLSENSSTESPEDELVEIKTQRPQNPTLNTLTVPLKRPVGRPRKHPLPPYHTPLPPKPRPTSIYQELESQGISAKDIQKYLLKKKVKKYVQQYVHKYQQPPTHTPYTKHPVEEEEEPFEEIEESSEEEQVYPVKLQTGEVDSNRAGENSKTKFNQIMGQVNRPPSKPRYSSYRY